MSARSGVRIGGASGNRTHVRGFADLCLTTRPSRQLRFRCSQRLPPLQAAAVIIKSKRYRTQPPKTARLRDFHDTAASLAHRFTPCFAILSDEALNKCPASPATLRKSSINSCGSIPGLITASSPIKYGRQQLAQRIVARDIAVVPELVDDDGRVYADPHSAEIGKAHSVSAKRKRCSPRYSTTPRTNLSPAASANARKPLKSP